MFSRISFKRTIVTLCIALVGIFSILLFRSPSTKIPPSQVLTEKVDRGLKPADEQVFRTKLDELLAQRAKNEAEGKRNVNLFLRLGVQYYILGEVANAAQSYRDILVTNPTDAAALENLGQALVEMGDYVGALEAWQRAATSEPTEATYVNMADLMRDHLPELDAQIPLVLEHGIATLGQKYGFLLRLGDWYAAHGDYARAVSHYEVALQLSKNDEAAKTLEIYRQKAREEEAKNLQGLK